MSPRILPLIVTFAFACALLGLLYQQQGVELTLTASSASTSSADTTELIARLRTQLHIAEQRSASAEAELRRLSTAHPDPAAAPQLTREAFDELASDIGGRCAAALLARIFKSVARNDTLLAANVLDAADFVVGCHTVCSAPGGDFLLRLLFVAFDPARYCWCLVFGVSSATPGTSSDGGMLASGGGGGSDPTPGSTW